VYQAMTLQKFLLTIAIAIGGTFYVLIAKYIIRLRFVQFHGVFWPFIAVR